MQATARLYFALAHIALFVVLALASLTKLHAEPWIPVFTRDFHSGAQETRFVDAGSVRAPDEYISYKFRTVTAGRVTLERTAWADCRSGARFEIVAPGDVWEKPFKSTFPGTSVGAEVEKACEVAKQPLRRELPPQVAAAPAPPEQSSPGPLPPSNPPVSRTSTGSGFAVQANYVVTNFHVVDSCKEVVVRQGQQAYAAEVVAETQATDLALLRTESRVAAYAAVRRTAALGEAITVAGHPLAGLLGTDVIVTGGQINSLAGLRNDPTLLQISAPVQPGNSGGPLIDRAGSIVGVVVSKLNVQRLARATGDFAQNINFAIKPELLRVFLDANQVPYKSTELGNPIDGIRVAQMARAYTVQVVCLK
jgi:S1-C subfamily serine protease